MLQGSQTKQTVPKCRRQHREWLVALGANLQSPVGSPQNTLQSALKSLVNSGAVIRATSPFYHTPAFPAGNGPDYVNAAVRIEKESTAEEMLDLLHRIEKDYGRERVQRWGQRTLDLDLIAAGELVLPDSETHARWRELSAEAQMQATPQELILPHPRMQDRPFVLVPLADIAPDWRHPVLGRTVLELRDALSEEELSAVRPLQ
jgi:2-amino-4-hydroxy-6-hydroxymethyldihydropteridine diphosphokinase